MLETRSTFADLGATVGELLDVHYRGKGTGFAGIFWRCNIWLTYFHNTT